MTAMPSQHTSQRTSPQPATLRKTLLCAALMSSSLGSYALDFGPNGEFSLTGFAEITATQQSNYCANCQSAGSAAGKQIRSSDFIIPGKHYGDVLMTNWQVQPYLGFKTDLGQGFKFNALLSQRYRQGTVDGKVDGEETRFSGTVDVPGYWYEKNIAISHEDWGSVRIGSMTTRSWSVADYPYGTNLGMASAWASSGAGYGMLANAVRVGSPLFDVAGGDLFVEASYDQGNTQFSRLKPALWELYAQFHKGDLVVDATLQNAKNGSPSAWGHAPFSGVTPFAIDDTATQFAGDGSQVLLGENQQSIAMVMGRYQATSQIELLAGLRYNRWSGANLAYSGASNWSTAFNVDFNNLPNVGYGANSVDALLGARYRLGAWMLYAGATYLGKAQTDNPSERGQSNAALINTFGANYDFGRGLQFTSTLGMVHYDRLGLAPMSMPGNDSFSNVDSRISQNGHWLTVGMVYAF